MAKSDKLLDADFSAGLANCDKRIFIHGGHYAFGYLAARYGLTYRSAQAVNPDAEPTPSTIAQLLKLVKSNGLKYVYAEELVSPRISEVIAKETGVKILMLHGAHNISKNDLAGGATFIGLMRKNLEQLRLGLACR
ncbi:MAG: zinc ABC transporter substrate-binding protein [Pseudomonadota bacterium]